MEDYWDTGGSVRPRVAVRAPSEAVVPSGLLPLGVFTLAISNSSQELPMSGRTKPTIYEEITNRIIESLQSGTIPWTRPWKTSGPCNATTRREYRGINKLLLWMVAQEKAYESSGWLTYRQAQSMGGQVRRGENASRVIWWSPVDVLKNGTVAEEPETRQFWIARTYNVFNLQQVDGVEKLEADLAAPLLDFTPIECCERVIEAYGADIRHGGTQAFYSPSGDYVQLPPIATFESRERYYATLGHELVHHSGHASRLNRDFTGRFGSEGYAREELVAELGSAFLSAQLGIAHQTRANAAYIASWLEVLRVDKRAIFDAAKLAQQAVDYIDPTQ